MLKYTQAEFCLEAARPINVHTGAVAFIFAFWTVGNTIAELAGQDAVTESGQTGTNKSTRTRGWRRSVTIPLITSVITVTISITLPAAWNASTIADT